MHHIPSMSHSSKDRVQHFFPDFVVSYCPDVEVVTSSDEKPHSTELSRLSKVLGPKVMSLQIRGDDIPISLDLRLNFFAREGMGCKTQPCSDLQIASFAPLALKLPGAQNYVEEFASSVQPGGKKDAVKRQVLCCS